MNHNIRKFYLWKFFSLNVFITPIYVIYFRSIGLSFVQIAALHLVRDIAIIVLEVPSGILADFVKRKTVLVLSAPCLMASMLLLAFSKNYVVFIIAFILWALAIALASGTSDAFAYEQIEDPRKIPVVTSNIDMIRRIGGILTKMGGPMLYVVNTGLPFIGSAIMGMFSFVMALSFKEKVRPVEKRHTKHTYLKNLKVQFLTKEIMNPLLSYAMFLGLLTTVFMYQSVKLESIGVTTTYLSVIYGAFFVVGAFGSYIARYINVWLKYEALSIVLYAIAVISIVIMGLSGNWGIVLLAMLGQSLIHGILFPSQGMHINQYIHDGNRSGILSLQSLIRGCFSSFITMFAGFIADGAGLNAAIVATALFPLVGIVFWTSIVVKRKKEALVGADKS